MANPSPPISALAQFVKRYDACIAFRPMELSRVTRRVCERPRGSTTTLTNHSDCVRRRAQPPMTEESSLGPGNHGLLGTLDQMLGRLVAAASLLVLPMSLLLFLQWPLREWLQAYSREANDLAQVLFALYVSVAITAATRYHAHLATDAFARRYHGPVRYRLARLGALFALIPWSMFVLYAAWPNVAQSVRQFEGFPETFNPGYFIIKVALLLLALLTLLQGVVEVFRGRDEAAL